MPANSRHGLHGAGRGGCEGLCLWLGPIARDLGGGVGGMEASKVGETALKAKGV